MQRWVLPGLLRNNLWIHGRKINDRVVLCSWIFGGLVPSSLRQSFTFFSFFSLNLFHLTCPLVYEHQHHSSRLKPRHLLKMGRSCSFIFLSCWPTWHSTLAKNRLQRNLSSIGYAIIPLMGISRGKMDYGMLTFYTPKIIPCFSTRFFQGCLPLLTIYKHVCLFANLESSWGWILVNTFLNQSLEF